MNILLVMLGGFIGAVLRFFIGEWLHSEGFPIGTLTVNLIGCGILGWLFSGYKKSHPKILLFFGTGLIGSFTTFSTFSVETMQLITEQLYLNAGIYILVSLIGGICFTFIGYLLASSNKVKKGENV